MKWISIEDSLPKNKQNILFTHFCEVHSDFKPFLGWFVEGDFCADGFVFKSEDITHWFPITEPMIGKLPSIVGNESTNRITIELIKKPRKEKSWNYGSNRRNSLKI